MDFPEDRLGNNSDDESWDHLFVDEESNTLWHDPLEHWFGTLVEPETAIRLISRLRRRYHHGPPEREILSEEQRRYFIRQAKVVGQRDLLPNDVREFRIRHYGDALEDLPLGAAGLVPTWLVLPPPAIPVSTDVVSYHRVKDSVLYLSHLSTGQHVYESTATAIELFFRTLPTEWVGEYYVFPPDLRWCLATSDSNGVWLVGEFNLFQPVSRLILPRRIGAPKVRTTRQLPGKRLYSDDTEHILAAFQHKYHQGQPGAQIWEAFPSRAFIGERAIFSHPHFLIYEWVYFSATVVEDFVSVASPVELERFFRHGTVVDGDFYIFDADLRWCIAVTEYEVVFIVGDFDIFALPNPS